MSRTPGRRTSRVGGTWSACAVALWIAAGCEGPPSEESFAIGGSVSGLVGTLELQLNDADPYRVMMDGPFVFPDELEDGTEFTVSIAAEPAGQTCSLSGGSGVVDGADVTSVVVTCSARLYALGGTVSGLNGELVLEEDAAGSIALTRDGAFTFPSTIADGSAYAVRIAVPEPLQRCALSGGAGAVDGADVGDVSVTCVDKTWHHPAGADDHLSPAAGEVLYPAVAMTPDGEGLLVWLQDYESAACTFRCADIYVRSLRDGVWAPAERLTADLPPLEASFTPPEIGVDGEGNVIVAWTAQDRSADCGGGPCGRVFLAERRGGAWARPDSLDDSINPLGPNDVSSLGLAVGADGGAVLAWAHEGAILSSEYREGAWSHPASTADAINPSGGTDARSVAVAADAQGNAIVVWEEAAPGPCSSSRCYQIFLSERRAGTWTDPATIDDAISVAGSNAYYPSAAMHEGRAIVAWEQGAIFLSEHDGSSWSHPVGVEDAISPDGARASDARVAISSAGAVVVWLQDDPDCTSFCDRVLLSERTDGTWTHPASVAEGLDPPGGGVESGPVVAYDDNGRIVVIWREYDGALTRAYFAERRRGDWTRPASLDDAIAPGVDAETPDVALSASGEGLMAWPDLAGGEREVYASRFE